MCRLQDEAGPRRAHAVDELQRQAGALDGRRSTRRSVESLHTAACLSRVRHCRQVRVRRHNVLSPISCQYFKLVVLLLFWKLYHFIICDVIWKSAVKVSSNTRQCRVLKTELHLKVSLLSIDVCARFYRQVRVQHGGDATRCLRAFAAC